MTVSMNGLRRNLGAAYAKAIKGFRAVRAEYQTSATEQLKEGLDELRQMIAGLYCVYSDKPDDLMTDMGDEADRLPYADPADAE